LYCSLGADVSIGGNVGVGSGLGACVTSGLYDWVISIVAPFITLSFAARFLAAVGSAKNMPHINITVYPSLISQSLPIIYFFYFLMLVLLSVYYSPQFSIQVFCSFSQHFAT